MKSRFFRSAIVFPVILLIPLTIGLGGCASKPAAPERPDSEKIQKDSDKGMQDLEKEEDRRGTSGY
jgi:hypothetical protein